MDEALDRLRERIVLEWHMRYNHHPPLDTALTDACLAALEALREDDLDRIIEMPDGVQYRGQDAATAAEIAESANLWELV